MDDLTGKTAVITGAASGIGLALARQFGAAGMNLVLADIEAPALDRAEAELREAGYETLSHVIDVRDLDQIRALEAAATKRFGNVHVLCNNAGVGSGGPVTDDDIELWRWTIDIDLWGVIYGCKVFLPGMVDHGEPAHIVNTASMAGLTAPPYMGAYNVSKYGVVALSETMTRELQLAGADVGVSVLCPAFVATAIADSERNLPAELRAGAEEDEGDGEMAEFVRGLVAAGMNPEVVAAEVLDAVRTNRFWILTHDETRAAVQARAEDIVNGVNPNVTPMG